MIKIHRLWAIGEVQSGDGLAQLLSMALSAAEACNPPTMLNIASARADTLMRTLEDRIRVARAALELTDRIAR